jgi:condensin complex subunit 3
LARVFVEYSLENQDESRLESSSLPVVTEFAFQIQEIYNSTVELFQQAEMLRSAGEDVEEDEEERDQREDEMLNSAFILSQMLKIAVKLDYADEIGRRKMFRIISEFDPVPLHSTELLAGDMLTHALLPEELIDPAMSVLKELLSSERELVQVVVEVIIEMRDPTGDSPVRVLVFWITKSNFFTQEGSIDGSSQGLARPEKSLKRVATREGLSQEEKAQADAADLRSLALCISMLKHVNSVRLFLFPC